MSYNSSQAAPEQQKPPAAQQRIRQMIADLDVPLDGLPTERSPEYKQLERKYRDARKAHKVAEKRKSRRDLQRAREAARRVFKVRPGLSARKTATAMVTAGAVGLAAFTAPPLQRTKSSPESVAAQFENPHQGRMPASLLKVSAKFKEALISEEGVRYVAYRDVAGYPTVGVGHLIEPHDNLRVGDRISKQQVLDLLEGDLAEAERQARDLVGNLHLLQHEFDALVDLVYNVGPGNVSERESPRLNAAINAGDFDMIAAELDYTHAGGQVARGLEYRSERRAKMFLDASYEDPREVAAASSTGNRS